DRYARELRGGPAILHDASDGGWLRRLRNERRSGGGEEIELQRSRPNEFVCSRGHWRDFNINRRNGIRQRGRHAHTVDGRQGTVGVKGDGNGGGGGWLRDHTNGGVELLNRDIPGVGARFLILQRDDGFVAQGIINPQWHFQKRTCIGERRGIQIHGEVQILGGRGRPQAAFRDNNVTNGAGGKQVAVGVRHPPLHFLASGGKQRAVCR